MKSKFEKEEWEEFLENIEFTDKERRIIEFMQRGLEQAEIAAELDASVSTVKRRMSSVINQIVVYVLRTRLRK